MGALLCRSWNDYLEAQVSKDHHLCRCDRVQCMMTMALLMVLAADRMRRQSSATARMESSMAMVAAADSNGRQEMIADKYQLW